MSNNPKIKVDAELNADTSSFEKELESLKQTMGQLGELLRSPGGKAQFNLQGSAKELGELLKRAERLTSVLDRGGKTSAQYAKNLKEAKEAMEHAARIAARLEDAGSSRSDKISKYFRGYANDLAGDHSEASRQAQFEREQAQRDMVRQARDTRWAEAAAKFVGFAGGATLGGNGVYSRLGSFAGSLLPGPWGMVTGAVGGMLGGAADRYITPAREEAKMYSELRRMLGSTTADFEQLRNSVRHAVDGLGIADNEAVNLARQFAKTADTVSGDDVARGVNTGSGFARGYGIAPEMATQFLASMRLFGVANNDKDNRRLAMLIGESVSRGGTSAKMDEVLGAISGFAAHSAQQMLLAPNLGQMTSYLASLTGSGYAGLKSNVGGAAQLLNIAEAGVQSGGTMGEASQLHWLMARQGAFKGMSALDNSLMQSAGLTGDLGAAFAPGSAAYDRAKSTGDTATVEHMDQLRKQIQDSGYRNNFEVAMAHIKAISGGNAYMENANFRGMFGGTVQQAAALMELLSKDPGLGKFEKQLGQYGVTLGNVNPAQIAAMSELMNGGDKAMSAQYEKLIGSGKLSAADLNAAEGLMEKEGYSDHFKKLLLDLTAKYDSDEGMESQRTQIQLTNEISRGVSNLIEIENDARSLLMGILAEVGGDKSVVTRIQNREEAAPFKSGDGLTVRGKAPRDYFMNQVDETLAEISHATTVEERQAIANAFRRKIRGGEHAYPKDLNKWLDAAVEADKPPVTVSPAASPSADTEQPTIPAEVKSSKLPDAANLSKRQHDVIGMVRGNSKWDKMIEEEAKAAGIDPLDGKMIIANESGFNPDAVHENSNGTRDLGLMQHNSKYLKSRGIEDNWRDPRANMRAGFKFYRQLLDRADGNRWKALHDYNGNGPQADAYANMMYGVYGELHKNPESGKNMPDAKTLLQPTSDKRNFSEEKVQFATKAPYESPMPRDAATPADGNLTFRHEVAVNLFDQKGNRMAEPFISTAIGAPKYAGTR
jgi:hypothetical protein